MSINIRDEQPGDQASIRKLNVEVFDTDAEAKLVDALRAANKLTLSKVAVAEGTVVGHIAFSKMQMEGQADSKLVGLGPMAVTPDLQKKGIGAALIRDSEQALIVMGYTAIFLLGHKSYYPRFGYQAALKHYGIYSKYEVPPEFFMAKELKPGALESLSGLITYQREFDLV